MPHGLIAPADVQTGFKFGHGNSVKPGDKLFGALNGGGGVVGHQQDFNAIAGGQKHDFLKELFTLKRLQCSLGFRRRKSDTFPQFHRGRCVV